MGKRVDHDKRNRAFGCEEILDREDIGSIVASATSAVRHKLDVDDLTYLIDQDHVIDSERVFLRNALAWLQEDGARILTFRQRAVVRAMRVKRSMRARGVVLERQPDEKRRPQGPRWPRRERPAWMANPTLLPKAPPPTHREDH